MSKNSSKKFSQPANRMHSASAAATATAATAVAAAAAAAAAAGTPIYLLARLL